MLLGVQTELCETCARRRRVDGYVTVQRIAMLSNKILGIVGLGYVGLPLAIAFGARLQTLGFDIDANKIKKLKSHIDLTEQVKPTQFAEASLLTFTNCLNDLSACDFFIIAVPTPIDDACSPDLTLLKEATSSVASIIKKGAIVVFESTVYPGVTEEICVGIIESRSGLKWKKDFFVGYSPERINPGDKLHGLPDVVKVVSGDVCETSDRLYELYSLVVTAGVFKATSIKVAETAKVIENTQRDLNIALMNEISKILDKLDISTIDVLKAAETKWNFLPFKPGLVGGHCIGVDPYYLTFKAQSVGYEPEVILAGRKINDGMAGYVAEKIHELICESGMTQENLTISILGISFKENCPDFRNSKVFDLMVELVRYGYSIAAHDPFIDNLDCAIPQGVITSSWEDLVPSAVVVCPVPHDFYKEIGASEFNFKLLKNGLFFDLKSSFDAGFSSNASLVWSL